MSVVITVLSFLVYEYINYNSLDFSFTVTSRDCTSHIILSYDCKISVLQEVIIYPEIELSVVVTYITFLPYEICDYIKPVFKASKNSDWMDWLMFSIFSCHVYSYIQKSIILI